MREGAGRRTQGLTPAAAAGGPLAHAPLVRSFVASYGMALALFSLSVSACTATRAHVDASGVDDLEEGPNRRPGVLHVVERGQTLWRIARAYGVTLQELAEVNDVVDPSQIAVGRALWIPRATKAIDVPPAPSLVARPEPAPKSPAPVKPEVVAHGKVAPPPKSLPPEEDAPPKLDVQPSRFAWPVRGTVSSRFGVRAGGMHDGIDILAPKGTAIVAADAGEVLYAGVQRGYGNIVLLKHADGLITVYAHNDENRVSAGDKVRRGQTIAVVGQTGRASAPHLHFEVREKRAPRNPLFFLPGQ